MRECDSCGSFYGHAPSCRKIQQLSAREATEDAEEYRAGWRDGMIGRSKPSSGNSSYRVGYRRGADGKNR